MSIRKAILTEKSKLQEKKHIYTFSVLPKLNKHQIKKELIDIFPDMRIKKIRTCIYKPVLQKTRYTRKLAGKHRTKLIKKAFVELVQNFDWLKKAGEIVTERKMINDKKK